MECVRQLTKDLYWVGADDRRLALFENIHPIPRGVSYNSYLLLDEKTVLFDTADWSVCKQFLENVEGVLNGRKLDYMIINHVEPDHAASIEEVLLRHPETTVISNEQAFTLMDQFGYKVEGEKQIVVKEGDTQKFGKHTIAFVAAPMVHWPEAMVSFDLTTGTLFSADAFGSFGALGGRIFNDEVNFDRDW
ncbi:MAG: FprA family A-type flavoprotein, partial [Acidaminococcus sp.]|nr:FprA family A-type flavoprotein [Acidaminococcus sp.]